MIVSKPILTVLVTLGIFTTGVMLSATPALALETNFKFELGAGILVGGPRIAIAVNDSSGDIYADNDGASNGSSPPVFIDRFDSAGHLLEALPAQFPFESSIAIDNSSSPSSGDLYVASKAELVVHLLNPLGVPVNFKGTAAYINGSELTGTPAGPFGNLQGVAVDGTGHLYVSDGGVVDIFNTEGIYERQLSPPGGDPSAIAVAANGTTYVVDGTEGGVVDVFKANGEFERQLTTTPTGPSGSSIPFNRPIGVTVDNSTSLSDPAAGDVYVSDENDKVVDVFGPEGKFLNQLTGPPGELFRTAGNLTVDASGNIYVANEVGTAGVIDVFTPAPVTIPDVVTGAASDIGRTTATIAGGVNPDGLDATCFVEYGSSSVPCIPADVGAGGSEVPITADLSGLSPRSTTYQYRVCAVNINDIPNCGIRRSFTTLPDRPTVLGESASFATTSEILLDGVVNPETGVTTFHYAYGPTSAYGQRFPSTDLAAGTGELPLALQGQSIVGLQPGTTYHYAVVATNAAGTTYGPDETFTTAVGPVPSAATGGLAGLSQQSATVSGIVDPAGVPTTYEFDLGTDTSYGTRVFGSAGTGSNPESFSASFESLSPNTTYHYRLLASNEYGTTYGADQTFTTPGYPFALPAAPTALALVAIPNVAFPGEAGTTTTTPTKKALTNAQKLAAALKACRGQEFGFERRKACEKQERKRYAPKKKKASKAKRASGRASGKGGN